MMMMMMMMLMMMMMEKLQPTFSETFRPANHTRSCRAHFCSVTFTSQPPYSTDSNLTFLGTHQEKASRKLAILDGKGSPLGFQVGGCAIGARTLEIAVRTGRAMWSVNRSMEVQEGGFLPALWLRAWPWRAL